MSTKPTAQDMFCEMCERRGRKQGKNSQYCDACLKKRDSQRQEPEAEGIEELADKVARLQWSPEDVDAIEVALRAYAASLRSKA